MKIINIIQRYPPAVGGSETWCQEICRYLAKRGHNVKVLTMDINKEEEYWREPLDEERAVAFGRLAFDDSVVVRRYRRSLPIHTIYHLFLKTLLDKLLKIYFYGPHSAEMYGKMWREIKKADIVFLHTIPYPHNYIAFVIAKIFRKKTIIIPHFHPGHPSYERRLHYCLLRNCDCVIAVTNFEKRYLERKGIPKERLFVSSNGIHPENYLPVNLDAYRQKIKKEYGIKIEDKVIIFIGRKIPDKGVEELIKAVNDLLIEMPLKLFLVGPASQWYNDLYAKFSDKEKRHIIEIGEIPHQDKVNLLYMSDLLVLPSKYEAFGIVFLEAWICGVPVVGTGEGAIPSVIGDDGFLCKFGDIEDLKLRIREAFSNMDRLREKGSKGKSKVLNNYTWEIIGKKTEEAIKTTVGKRKILFCCNAYPPYSIGGAELIAHRQAKVLKRLGNDVIIFAGEPNNNGKRYSIRLEYYEGLPVYRVCLHARDYSSDFFNFFHKDIHKLFDDLIESISPDVVHFHNIIGLSVGLIQIAKRRGIKTVLTLHDYWGICYKNTLLKHKGRICEKTTECEECKPVISGERWRGVPHRMRRDYVSLQLQKVDTFISPSNYLAERYVRAGFNREKIKIVPNGIDLERFIKISKNNNNERIKFSFVGYLGQHKGVHTIIEALSLIERKEQIYINFAGNGEDRTQIESMVKQIGCDSSVKFWGQIDNSQIEDVYQNTDVLILPSIWPDNHPASICEAMASRIPVIASRMGGIPELVEDGKTGYLFEAGNANELAQKMSELISDRTKLKEFGDNAFQKISDYPIDNQVKRILEIYNEDSSSLENYAQEDNLIVCLGKEVHTECAKAMEMFLRTYGQYRILMFDWLEEEEVKKAKLLWVVDKETKPEEITTVLRNKLPLIVPDNDELKNLCRNGECGLSYKDALEALACLEHLTKNEPIRKIMGQNSFKFFYSKETREYDINMGKIESSALKGAPMVKVVKFREKMKGFLEDVPLIGHFLLWAWRLINLPTWFYRLSRHFESVVEQVDTTIKAQSDMNRKLESLTSIQGTHDSIIQHLSQSLKSISTQLERMKSIQNMQEKHDSAIQQITQSLDSLTAQLNKSIDTKDTYLVDIPPYISDRDENIGDESAFYLTFENIFRGTKTEIDKRQRLYILYVIDAFRGAKKGKYFLDIGCGRGEFLKILKEVGVPYKGIEINTVEYEKLKSQDINIELADANTFLNSVEDNTLIGISGFQVIEHLTQEYLKKFISLAYKKIASNGVIILESINPKCIVSLGNFYLDPTHTKPYPPELLKYLLEWYSFRDIKIIYLSPCLEEFRSKTVPQHNYIDYAVVGWKR